MSYRMVSFNIYYTDLDRLILKGLQPLYEAISAHTSRWFWERHYAGGRHLQLRLWLQAKEADTVYGLVEQEMTAFFQNNPCEDDASYDAKLAHQLLVMEEENPADYDLTYRNHQICRGRYFRNMAKYPGEPPVRLMEDFYQDVHGLLVDMLRHPDGKEAQLLKLFFLNAWLDSGSFSNAGISYRSHWEGFKMQMQMREATTLVDAIEKKERELRDYLRSIMHACAGSERAEDPILAAYERLSLEYRSRARDLLERGEKLFHPFDSKHNHQYLREVASKHELSQFTQDLHYSDFLSQATKQIGFNVVRTATNLMYLLIPALGLAPIHKFKLGYFAFRTIELNEGMDTHAMFRRAATTDTSA